MQRKGVTGAIRAGWYERLRLAGANGRAIRLPASTLYSLLMDCEKLLACLEGDASEPAAALAADLELLVEALPLQFV